MKKYDIIVIGAGPNGLTTASYLSKAGLSVLVLEKKTEVGGGLATEEVTLPDFYHNTHSIYHMMVEYAPPYRDLELHERYRLQYVYPSLQVAMPLMDGKTLCLYTDVERSCKSIAKFSQRDAKTYRELYYKLHKYMEEFLAPATYTSAIPALEQAAKLESSDLGREITAYSGKSPKKIIDELFENEHVKTLMLYLACHWGLEYDLEGVGYLVLIFLERATHSRLCVGGSHMLSQLINKVILENKGMTWGSQIIKRLIIKDGIAKGVEFEDGTIAEANKAIVSSLDPYQTFLKLVGEEQLTKDFIERVKDWKWEKWSLLQIHMALESRPNFKAAEHDPEINNALMYVIGYESLESLIRHWKKIDENEPCEDAGFNCCFPSIHDPLQAPPGKCTGLISQMSPYDLKGNAQNWLNYKFKKTQAEKRQAILRDYATNINKETILWTSVTTPADTENKFANMIQGSIKQGAYHPFQMGYLRPNEECSQHRTPIRNLFLCGASTHSGGLVTFGPGYNAANAIAEDLGIDKWWSEPTGVLKAKERGLL